MFLWLIISAHCAGHILYLLGCSGQEEDDLKSVGEDLIKSPGEQNTTCWGLDLQEYQDFTGMGDQLRWSASIG